MSMSSWVLPDRFVARLVMESDWHVGTGMGRPGSVDRLVARDVDGLPYVPAKTLHGMWRDACERLCLGLDGGAPGAWLKMVDCIFGSQPSLGPKDPTGRHADPTETPLGSAIEIRPARIPLPLREYLVNADYRLRQALTFIKPGVKIDPRSGSAEEDCLRLEELGRRGTVLEAECRLRAPDLSGRELASALLIASAKLVTRLGGKRRRGTGRCRLVLIYDDGKQKRVLANEEKAIDWLESHLSPPHWHVPTQPPSTTAAYPRCKSSTSWLCVPLRLHLEEPVAVSYRIIGNVVETLDFVPGWYLLPHITSVLPQLRSALASGGFVISPAYPEIDGERGLPLPLALFELKGGTNHSKQSTEKSGCAKLLNRLVEREPATGEQYKQVRGGFISVGTRCMYKTPLVVQTHNTVEDQSQRPTEVVGGVYTYEAIAPRDGRRPVVLFSELRLPQSLADQLPSKWWEKLAGEVVLGRSKKDDYGRARVHVEAPRPLPAADAQIADELVVWCISDILVRNERLQLDATSDSLAVELSKRLGVRLTRRQSANGGLDECVRVRRFDTWHVGWGLPRPSLVAIQAGSCIVFRVGGNLDPQRLALMEVTGIGERTAEGFGQLLFNHPLLTQTWVQVQSGHTGHQQQAPMAPSTLNVNMTEETRAFARLIEMECWKQEIRRKCLEVASDKERRKQLLKWDVDGGKPPMSQLGGLRGQIARLGSADQDRRRVLDWLGHLEGNSRRRERWPDDSLLAVRRFLENRDHIWQVLGVDEHPTSWPVLIADAKRELMVELWPLAIRTFFDACIRAHKRELEQFTR